MKKLMQDWNDGWPVALVMFFLGGLGMGLAALMTIIIGRDWSYEARLGLVAIILAVTMPVPMHRFARDWYRARAFEAMMKEQEAERIAENQARRLADAAAVVAATRR